MTTETVTKSDLDDFLEENEVAGAVSINPSDLINELLRMASLYSRFGVLAAKARKQRDGSKSILELTEAKLDRKIRQDLTDKAEKFTEGKIQSILITQSAYQDGLKALADATEICSVAETTLNALAMKRDMLVQLNKNMDREWDATSSRIPMGEGSREQLKEKLRQGLAASGSNRN